MIRHVQNMPCIFPQHPTTDTHMWSTVYTVSHWITNIGYIFFLLMFATWSNYLNLSWLLGLWQEGNVGTTCGSKRAFLNRYKGSNVGESVGPQAVVWQVLLRWPIVGRDFSGSWTEVTDVIWVGKVNGHFVSQDTHGSHADLITENLCQLRFIHCTDRLIFSESKNYSTSYSVHWEEWGTGEEVGDLWRGSARSGGCFKSQACTGKHQSLLSSVQTGTHIKNQRPCLYY